MMVRRAGIIGALAALVTLGGCSRESSDSPLSPSPAGRLGVESLATSVAVDAAQGIRRGGRAPAPSGGPQVTLSGNDTVVTGGTQAVMVTSDSSFDTIYLWVGGQSLGLLGATGGGIEGYYEVRLPGPVPGATALLTLPIEVPLERFDLQVAVRSPGGAVGPPAALPTRVLGVGTGDVQVTLAWDVNSDVDLHVVGPGGDEIYFGRRESPSGGTLDLDSNAGCRIDGVRNENITWPVGRAPAGEYVVRVNYWSSCGVARTNYTVRINNGGAVQIVTGTLTGPGQGGGLGAGEVVARFQRTTGPSAITFGLAASSAADESGKPGPAPAGAGR